MAELRLYRPSNGSEGEGFEEQWCERCERDVAFRANDEGYGCLILARALAHDITDPEYPREWCQDEAGTPRCTAFVEIGGKVPTDLEAEAAGQAVLFAEVAR
jgi:hypothetical protein